VTGRLSAFAVSLGLLAAATSVAAGERPGSIESQIATVASPENAQAVGVLPNQRIVVAGSLGLTWPQRGFIRGFLPGGGSDPGFGDAGEVRFESNWWVGDMAVAPDGRILIAFTVGPPRLIRLHPDGSRDASFGDGGVLDVDFGRGASFEGLALYPGERIVAVGSPVSFERAEPVAVRRLLANGSPDPSFGASGQVDVDVRPVIYAAPAVQPDGGIILAMLGGGGDPLIARISADGRLDPAFGRGGVAPLELGRRGWLADVHAPYGYSWRALVLGDGRIRVPVIFGTREHGSRIGLVGLTADGHADRRFGRDGLALGPRPRVSDRDEWPRVAILDGQGGILVSGATARGDTLNGSDSSVVRRFRRDGTLDLSFGRSGLVRDTFGRAAETLEQELAMVDDDTAVLVEESATTRYSMWHGGAVYTLNVGYDRDDPSISLVAGCRAVRVRVTDLSGIDAIIVRADGRVIRRTTRKRFRVRLPVGAQRVSVRATDLARNVARERVRLGRC
jgi:uncharacterized delta-60 repeat protein